MDVTFDHIITHHTIDNIVGFMLSGTNNQRIIEEVAHVDEGVGTDTFIGAKVLEGVIRMETIDCDLKLLTIARGV